MEKQKLSRKELYNLVWSKPQKEIAVELKIKVIILKKICKEFKIPMPKVGYWSKIAYGKKVYIEKLRINEGEQNELIDIKKYEAEGRDKGQKDLAQKMKEIEFLNSRISKGSKKLNDPVLLIKQAKAFFDKEKSPRWRGFDDLIICPSGMLSIQVTKINVERILSIANSFIKLLLKRGHAIKVSGWKTIVTIDGEDFEIKFREKCNRKKDQEDRWFGNILVPNGILSVKLVVPYSTIEWKDGTTKLEQQLTKVIASLELRAEKEKLERKERKKYQAEQNRIREIELKKLALKEMEERKIEMLLDYSSKWNKSQDLKLFIEIIETRLKNTEITKREVDWLVWAKSVEKSLNPLSRGLNLFIENFEEDN